MPQRKERESGANLREIGLLARYPVINQDSGSGKVSCHRSRRREESCLTDWLCWKRQGCGPDTSQLNGSVVKCYLSAQNRPNVPVLEMGYSSVCACVSDSVCSYVFNEQEVGRQHFFFLAMERLIPNFFQS